MAVDPPSDFHGLVPEPAPCRASRASRASRARRRAVVPLDIDAHGKVMTRVKGQRTSEEPNKVKSKRRPYLMNLCELRLESFLRTHGFSDAHEGKMTGCLFKDLVYPIHVAAELGDVEIIKLLIKANVDLDQKTRRGKTALELARRKDRNGSHLEAVTTLWQPLQIWSARQMVKNMSTLQSASTC